MSRPLPPFSSIATGGSRKILLRDIEEANRKGVHIIMLYPFKHDFYVKLGFGLGFEGLEYTVDCSLLSGDMEEDNLKLVSRRLLEKDEMRELISQTRKTLWETSRYTKAIEIDA